MSLKWRIIFFSILAGLCTMINQCYSERKLYISLERPIVEYSNPKLVTNLVVKSRRLSRGDPIHYVTLNATTLVEFNKFIKVEIAFYELLSNMYKRSFVEWRISGCEFLEKDNLLGPSFRAVYARSNGKPLKCPLPPGNYSFKDMHVSLSSLLYSFPFQEGRLFVNVSRLQERGVEAHIDFQIKSFSAERNIDKKN